MSRSRRHVPIRGWAKGASDRWYKEHMHRRWRVALRLALAAGEYDRATYDNPYSPSNNECAWSKDGKGWFGGSEDAAKLMRK